MTDTTDARLCADARAWAEQDPDPETRAEAEALADAAEAGDDAARAELRDRFDGRLAFGTAGLRAELGAGPRRMNRVVVSQTSAGFAAYLRDRAARGATTNPPTAVVGYDGRVGSEVFARDAAEVLAGAGIRVTLLPEAGPTPLTAFAVRHLGASAGVMITASHNPPRDNGYKVYLGDADGGSQIAPPVDAEIAARIAVAAERPFSEIERGTAITIAGPELADAYVRETAAAVVAGIAPDAGSDLTASLTVVYTAMHGVGAELGRRVFSAAGLPHVLPVPEQDRPDGDFPTLAFPNPEEEGALDFAYALASDVGADLIVAHDPDADRLGLAAPDPANGGAYRRLSGNELGLLLGWRAAERRLREAERDGIPVTGSLANTIVSSPALGAVARAHGLGIVETLSGFKWVSRVPDLVFGYEEALGYLPFPGVVRDKDGIQASADAIAMVRELAAEGRTVWDRLDEASERFGHFTSSQIVVRLDGVDRVERLAELVRQDPPTEFGGVEVKRFTDLRAPGAAEVPANVLRFDLSGGSRVMIRPSGTEPKLKIYLDARSGKGSVADRRRKAEKRLRRLESAVRDYLDGLQAEPA